VVFPKTGIERAVQVLMGSYPVAQVREPYSVIRYLAEHCDPPLPVAYNLAFPHKSDSICSPFTTQVSQSIDGRWDGMVDPWETTEYPPNMWW